MPKLSDWLRNLGLSEYTQRFVDNGIDFSVLPDLTEQDLKDLGVLLGHRRKLLRAIVELDGTPSVASTPAYSAIVPASICTDEAAANADTSLSCFVIWWALPDLRASRRRRVA